MFSKPTLLPAGFIEFLNQQNKTVKWIHIHFRINYLSTNMNIYLWINMNLLNAIWIIHCMVFNQRSLSWFGANPEGASIWLTFFWNLNLTSTLHLVAYHWLIQSSENFPKRWKILNPKAYLFCHLQLISRILNPESQASQSKNTTFYRANQIIALEIIQE